MKQIGQKLLIGAVASVFSGSAVFAQEHGHTGHSHPGATHEAESWWHQSGLTGEWHGGRQALEARGIVPYATYIGEFFANSGGGLSDGSVWAGLLDFGVEVDLDKTIGWEGGVFYANAFYFEGNDVSGDFVGDFNAVSNLYTTTSFNVYNIFLRQSLSDRSSTWFKVGQLALDDDFMVSETSLLFLNASFGPLPTQSGNLAAPIYSLAAPGLVVHAGPVDDWYLQAAVYAGDAGPAESDNQGFEWRTGGSAGWSWFAESGIHYADNDESVLKLGAYYHAGDVANFANGGTEDGLFSVYAVLDHRLVDASESACGVSLFVRGGYVRDDELAVVDGYVDAGFVLDGIFRDEDALGFAVSHTGFADDFRVVEGGTSSETVFELTYQTRLSEWCVIQPDLQYIVDPQSNGKNSFVFGLRTELSF
jgi:porin